MSTEITRKFVDQIVTDDNIEAGATFKTLMQNKQLDSIDLKRIETQLDWLSTEQIPEQYNELRKKLDTAWRRVL